jgi:(p)ppGpp synthase/HD superfamily hydrolase
MPETAQTSLRLFNQAIANERPPEDLQGLRDSYDLAMVLFRGLYRPSGKTFIAHLAGTCSLLLADDLPLPVLQAGILHAAYTHGRFGGMARWHLNRQRGEVRRVTSIEAEALVHAYARLSWDEAAITRHTESWEALGAADRNVVLIRLANEVDDHLDGGMRYAGKSKKYRVSENNLRAMERMAETAGAPRLARSLVRTLSDTSPRTVPAFLQRSEQVSFYNRSGTQWTERLARKLRHLRLVKDR